MKTKLTLLLLCLFSCLFSGCFKEQSVYGTYSGRTDDITKWYVVMITEPNFFTIKDVISNGEISRENSTKRGIFEDYGDYLFLETDSENNKGYRLYLTDKSFNKVQFGGSSWRETLYRIK